MNFNLVNKRVVIKVINKETTSGGIVLSSQSKDPSSIGEIVKIGDGAELEVGQVVIFGDAVELKHSIDGEVYLLMMEDNVLCVIESE